MPLRRRLCRILIAVAVAFAVALAVLFRMLRPAPVTVEAVARGRAIEAAYATGTVEPVLRVPVKARISEHVAEIAVKEGDAVIRGGLLARIEDPGRRYALWRGQRELAMAEIQASKRSPQLAMLEAQARALRAQLDLAKLDLARDERLAATGAVTASELDTARTRVDQLAAQTLAADELLRSTRLQLGAARDQLTHQVGSLSVEVDESEVRAPIDGVVLHRDVEPGEVVAVNQTMFEIADTSVLLVELHVDEADIARVRDGAKPSEVALSFYAFPGRAFAGHVAEILPEPDPVRRAYTVKVALDQPIPGLRVGMTAEANVIVARKDGVLLVPIDALDGNAAWFVEDGRAVKRAVELGIRDLTHAEVISGAHEGALAIAGGSAGTVSPGHRVTVEMRR